MDDVIPVEVGGRIVDPLGPSARVCLTLENTTVAAVDTGADGRFELRTRSGSGKHLLLVLADGREAVRQELAVESPALTIDVGEVVLTPVELSAGVHGELWDSDAQSPIRGGTVELSAIGSGGVLGRTFASPDGAFSIRMTCRRPLPPGDYTLTARAPGYVDDSLRFGMPLSPTVIHLGRVPLERVLTEV